jgi:AAHS family 4-hydroxybenzoate transporter-like MFS transporter
MIGGDQGANIFDNRPIGRVQWRIFFLLALVAMVDGFNAQALSIIAPALASEWHFGSAVMTRLFVAALCGTAIGSCSFGWIADRVGRKPVLLSAIAVMGMFSFASANSSTVFELGLFRFIEGVGLGAALPNILTLTVEYSPERHRNIMVNAVMCGFPVGGALGGMIVGHLLHQYGWRSALVLGGCASLVLVPVLALGLVESLRFLSTRNDAGTRINSIMKKMGIREAIKLPTFRAQQTRAPLRAILSSGLRFGTIVLWVMSACANIVQYFLISWSPWMLKATGVSASEAAYGAVALGVGSTLGALAIGRVMDRFGAYAVVAIGYLLSVFTIAGISFSIGFSLQITLIALFVAGVFVVGARFGVSALTTGYFPTQIRATGVSSCYGISQVGSVLGPLVGGMLISIPLDYPSVFRFAAIPAILNAVLGYTLYRRLRTVQDNSILVANLGGER